MDNEIVLLYRPHKEDSSRQSPIVTITPLNLTVTYKEFNIQIFSNIYCSMP